MRIFIDTTELYEQDELKQLHWERLKTLAEGDLIEIALSEATIGELVRQWRERYESRLVKLGAVWADFQKVNVSGPVGAFDGAAFDALAESAAFRRRLLARLAELNIDVLTLPSATHDEVLTRDFASQKPFNRDGKGYRDTLIWVTFLEWLASGPRKETLFVSGNTNDFGKNGFDASLIKDLDSIGDVDVSLRTKLSDEVEILWKRLDGETLLEAASNQNEEFGFEDAETASLTAIENAAVFLIEEELVPLGHRQAGFIVHGLELPDWPEPLTIGSIQFANETFDLQLIEDFGEGTQYFSATIRAAIDTVGLLPKGQAFASGLTITAIDYNHHYSEVALSFDCQIEFQVRYEAGDGGSAKAELIGITDAQLT